MADPTPVVLTLGGDSYIREPSRIIAYILNHYVSAPKSATTVWYDQTVSAQHTIAEYKDRTKEDMLDAMQRELTACYSRIFGAGVSVRLTAIDETESEYRINISVAIVRAGETYGLDRNVQLTNDGRLEYVTT